MTPNHLAIATATYLRHDGVITVCPPASAKGAGTATFKMHIRFGKSRRRSYRLLHSLEVSGKDRS